MPLKSSRGLPPNVSECCLVAGHLYLGFRLVLGFHRVLGLGVLVLRDLEISTGSWFP